MSDIKVTRRFGMVDEASGYVPIYFGETTNTPPHGVAGPEYVLLSDYEKLEAEKAEAAKDCDMLLAWAASHGDEPDILVIEMMNERRRVAAAEAQVADLKAKVERLPTWLFEAIQRWPEGTSFTVEYDGFAGRVRGWYLTEEGKLGVVGQFTGTKMCHVYNEARAALSETRS